MNFLGGLGRYIIKAICNIFLFPLSSDSLSNRGVLLRSWFALLFYDLCFFSNRNLKPVLCLLMLNNFLNHLSLEEM